MDKIGRKRHLERVAAIFIFMLIVISLPNNVQSQYFAKVPKQVPRLGRRIDPAMADLMSGVSGLSKRYSTLFKELDGNEDNCLDPDEFRSVQMYLMTSPKSPSSSLSSAAEMNKRGGHVSFDNLLSSAMDEK